MNLKGFFGEALSQALDLGIATPDDVIKHVTPELLAAHLPRPLWARLLTACLGAPKVDAQLVVETIGIPNLCEHVPTEVVWNCISEIASRALGREFVPAPVAAPLLRRDDLPSSSRAAPLAMTPPPAEQPKPSPSAPAPRPRGPSIPPPTAGTPVTSTSTTISATPAPADSLADVVAALEADAGAQPVRARTPTSQRFRQSATGGVGRFANNSTRRPQAPAQAEPPKRRGSTEVNEYEMETEVGKEDWKSALAVEEDQLVDWSSTETQHDADDFTNRKR